MAVSPDYRLLTGPPAVEDYLRLRQECGLSVKTPEQGRLAVAGAWSFHHVLRPIGEVVGMGRVIGDGGWYFLIADMATLPDHQGRGIGGAILDALLDDIRSRAPQGAYVTLTADPPGRGLYESRGFVDVSQARTGMHLLDS